MDQSINKVVISIRSCILQYKNGRCKVSQLAKDYREIEGNPIPYRLFGFSVLEDFLLSTNQFILNDTEQGTVVTAKWDEHSRHIVQLLKEQNPARESNKSMKPKMVMESHLSSSNTQKNTISKSTENHINKTPFCYWAAGNNHTTITPELFYISNPQFRQSKENVLVQPKVTLTILDVDQNGNNFLGIPFENSTPDGLQLKTSVQSRLNIQKFLESEKELDMLADNESDTIVPIEQIEQSEDINFDELNKMDPIEAIGAYCSKMNIDQPVYTDYYVQKSKKYICSITIDDKSYSTYPDEFSNLFEAKKCAARNAFIEIRQFTEGDKLSVCTDSSEQIATKIFNIIANNGRFFDSIPLAFQKEYNCCLPRHWEQIVYKNTNLFLLETNEFRKLIIYPKIFKNNESG